MDVRPIRTEADYEWALEQIEAYFEHEPEPGTPEADRFEVLTDLIEAYEDKKWPIEPPGALQAILYHMELKGLGQQDLAKILGSRSRASEVLARKRALTTDMIQKLNRAWGIPAESLIKPYKVAAKRTIARKRKTRGRKAA